MKLHTHTHTHTAVLRPFVRVYPGEPVPEETLTTLLLINHPYQLPPSTSETTNRVVFTETNILMHFYKKTPRYHHYFPWLSMTLAVFHDFPGLENGLTKFHDFPGRVVTLHITTQVSQFARYQIQMLLSAINQHNRVSTVMPAWGRIATCWMLSIKTRKCMV